MTAPFPLSTSRLTLRLYEPDDLTALLGYYSQPQVARYLLDEPWTQPFAEQQVQKRLQRQGLDTPAGALAVVWEVQGEVIGDAALWLTDDTGKVAEIGWVLHPDFAGQGFATEAVGALLNVAFEWYSLHRVAAQMDARNLASGKLCERLGMKKEAYLRQNWWSKGEWTDTVIYAVLATDRRESPAKYAAASPATRMDTVYEKKSSDPSDAATQLGFETLRVSD